MNIENGSQATVVISGAEHLGTVVDQVVFSDHTSVLVEVRLPPQKEEEGVQGVPVQPVQPV